MWHEDKFRPLVTALTNLALNIIMVQFWGLYGVVRNKAIERKYNYFCSQFVASVLERSGIHILDKQPGLVRPDDFRKSSNVKVIYKGLLRRYREYLWTHDLAQAFGGHVTKQAM